MQLKRDASRIAAILTSSGFDAACYHGGLSAFRRQQVEKDFREGNVRIVVATVAFGMGIDNQHVDAVIHAYLPRSIESYVQEVGRAGRRMTQEKISNDSGNPIHKHLLSNARVQETLPSMHYNTEEPLSISESEVSMSASCSECMLFVMDEDYFNLRK